MVAEVKKSEKQEPHSRIKPLKSQTCKFCKKNDSLIVCYNLKFQTVLAEIGFCSGKDNVSEDASCSDEFCAPSEGANHSVWKTVLAGKLNVKIQFHFLV